jgi:predicted esterase
MKLKRTGVLLALLAGVAVETRAAEPLRGYHKKVGVTAPTRIDWTFAVSTQSVAKPPADWLGDYDSLKQSYELFVPPNYDPKQSYPVVLFISPGNGPAGWSNWEAVCKKHGVLFASPYEAGNNVQGKKRIRIVLDVLDELRRTYNIDPDRTYISGFSGGGRIACGIAFGLPEYFGGVIPVCAAGNLREESWLRHRVIERLSVAFVTGESDFNRGECERFRGPLLKEVGVRTRVWVVPKMGHSIPGGGTMQEVFQWVEEGRKQRQELAKKYPASRIAGSAAPSREEWAKLLFAEGKQRLQARETLYSGLMQLQGCMNRWVGLPVAAEARKLLLEYEAKPDKPWEEDDIAEQRRFLIASARSLDAYASGPLPEQYAKQRASMAKQALELWQMVVQDGPNTPAGQEGKKRIAELQKLVDKGE